MGGWGVGGQVLDIDKGVGGDAKGEIDGDTEGPQRQGCMVVREGVVGQRHKIEREDCGRVFSELLHK